MDEIALKNPPQYKLDPTTIKSLDDVVALFVALDMTAHTDANGELINKDLAPYFKLEEDK